MAASRMTPEQIAAMASPFWPWAPVANTQITVLRGAISQNITYEGDGEALRDLHVMAAKGQDGRWYYESDDRVWAVADQPDMMRLGW
jgi:hypothetical protein